MSRHDRSVRTGSDRANLYDEITTKIIAELEAGRVPWVQPWGTSAAKAPLGLPKNATTGRSYSGINVLILWGAVIEHGFPSQGWLTFRQALSLGGNVRKGERGTTVGYAEMMLARHTGLVAIPDELSSEEAAPILCAGIATFNALKKSGAEAGDTVAIFGIGGLGHMAVQYARKMGFRVVAIGRGADIAADALALGAHLYIDTEHEDAAQALQALGGAKAIVSTPVHAAPVAALMPGLTPEGRMVLLGGGKDPLPVAMGPLISGERSVMGSITGSPFENEKTLAFSVLTGARPMIETMPLEKAAQAYEKMKSGDVKFRMVLTMKGRADAHQ